MLPPFESSGRLPPGIHVSTWALFRERFGTSVQRRDQLEKLKVALRLLRAGGCARVFVGGSFVTAKHDPADVDVAWDMTGVDAERVDAIFFDFADERAAQKNRFRAEFFPAQLAEGATGRSFLRFFQFTRDDEPVGIVELDLETLPQGETP